MSKYRYEPLGKWWWSEDSQGKYAFGSGDEELGVSFSREYCSRLVECVNACKGIENPAGLQKLFSEIRKADMCSELRDGLMAAYNALGVK